jgi:hypothetical protein
MCIPVRFLLNTAYVLETMELNTKMWKIFHGFKIKIMDLWYQKIKLKLYGTGTVSNNKTFNFIKTKTNQENIKN